ncbi:MAG: VCBS repeat-containing protein [Gammaproteobacteria bacterium]|nr:VCBS repeat-containing protein [Gammaproteobacteria bacterium]
MNSWARWLFLASALVILSGCGSNDSLNCCSGASVAVVAHEKSSAGADLGITFQDTVIRPEQIGASSFDTLIPGLLRQADCSLNLLKVARKDGALVSTGTHYQNILRQKAGLETTSGIFSQGCADQLHGMSGQPWVSLGRLTDGKFLGVVASQINYRQIIVAMADEQHGLLSYHTIDLAPDNFSYVQLMVAGDFNGDGHEDVAVTLLGNDRKIAVLLNHGDGSLAAPVFYLAGIEAFGITTSDFNGDGRLDLAVSTLNGGNLKVLTGQGNGAFNTPLDGPLLRGNLVAADFNGDGRLDLASSNGDVLLGRGDGRFDVVTNTGVLSGLGIGVGDLNRDGKMDLVMSSLLGGSTNKILYVYLGNGDGRFTRLEPGYALIRNINYSIGVTDLDGDANPDVVIGGVSGGFYGPSLDSSGMTQFLLGRGDGRLAGAPLAYSNATDITADFNGDGHADLLGFSQGSNGIQPLLGNGQGEFVAGPVSPTSFDPQGFNVSSLATDLIGGPSVDLAFMVTSSGSFNTSRLSVLTGQGDGRFRAEPDLVLPYANPMLTAADFNGDGRIDLAGVGQTSSSTSALFLLSGTGGGFASPTTLDPSLLGPGKIVSADVNADGRPDLVVMDAGLPYVTPARQGNLRVYLNQGGGGFQAAEVLAGGGYFDALAIGDINGDHRPDIIATIEQGSVGNLDTLLVFLGIGDGHFQAPLTLSLPDTFLQSIVIGDFDSDDKPDLLVGGCCGQVYTYFLQGRGNGQFDNRGSLPLGVSTRAMSVTDFNGDGRPDVAAWRESYVAVFLSTATVASTAGDALILSGDYNGDGKADLVWRNQSTGQVYGMLLDGFSIQQQGLFYQEPNTAWRIVQNGDLDGDGQDELIWWNAQTGQVYRMPMSGLGIAGGALVYQETNTAWRVVAVGDLNGDGRDDLIWWNDQTGQVYGMLMQGATITAQGLIYQEANTAWRILAARDFTGDGKADLLWRNQSTGQVYLMPMNGLSIAGGAMVYQEANLAWSIVATGDLDGDQRTDLVWWNDQTGQVYGMLMNGAVIAAQGLVYQETNTAWRIVASGDYTGDGKADLLWRNGTTGQVYEMPMHGLLVASGALLYQEANPDWQIVANEGVPRLPAPSRSLPGAPRFVPLSGESLNPYQSFDSAPINSGALPVN